jgi:hypothetical protein
MPEPIPIAILDELNGVGGLLEQNLSVHLDAHLPYPLCFTASFELGDAFVKISCDVEETMRGRPGGLARGDRRGWP